MSNNVVRKIMIIIGAILAILVVSNTWATSSVWKVSKGNNHIFIGGTVHLLPPSAFPLPSEFDMAYKKSDSIVLETKLPDASDTGFQMKMMQQMAYGNGKTIGDFLSKRTMKQLSQHISALGVDLAMFEGFKPGFLVTMLSLLEAKKSGLSGDGVDIFYSKQATIDKKPIEYFESAEFQINMIANMGKDNEDKFIKSNLEQLQNFKSMFIGLLEAWRTGDDKQLNKLVIIPMKADPKTLKALLIDRNRNWIKDIDKMFTDNDREFVLVGVAHLVGNNSVLALLKAKGYRVEKM
jgi:uncharacterized protein YbaP (TraB family)